jgi:hypothetical protein
MRIIFLTCLVFVNAEFSSNLNNLTLKNVINSILIDTLF